MKQREIAFVILILLGIIGVWVGSATTKEPFGSALNHPTKCFDCEKQYVPQYAWVGQSTKCFSCEQQALRTSGGNPSAVFDTHPIKYYETAPMVGGGIAKMGYMR